MKKLKLIPAIAALFITSFVACKKKDKESTPQQKIVGKWKEAYLMHDDNNNNVMDDAQLMPTPAGLFTFNSDGSGSISAVGALGSAPILWSLINSNADMQVVIEDPSGNDTSVIHISALTDSKLTFKGVTTTATSTVPVWDVYEKQ